MKKLVLITLLTSIVFFSSTIWWLKHPSCNVVFRHLSSSSAEEYSSKTETNVSHILFGIGGSTRTWRNRSRYTELWWRPNVTRGFVWLDREPTEKDYATATTSSSETEENHATATASSVSSPHWPAKWPPYKVSEDTSRFRYTNSYGSRAAIRIARIVVESYRLGLGDVRWYVLGDDDTVFFVENLVEVLSGYEWEEMYYIGGNSESVEQDTIHSYGMAYGGGGIVLSRGLVVRLVEVLDGCIDRYSELYGSDERIGACVSEIGVPLTTELGFHQVDIRGDPYGLLAAHPVAPLISLHHLDSVKPIFPRRNKIEALKSLIAVHKTDPGRTLQQSFCYDLKRNWSVSVSWGYTVQIYPSLLTAKQLVTPFQTFSSWRTWSKGPFAFNTRRLSHEACERPVIFYLHRVEEIGTQETLTTYKKFWGEEECELATYAPILALQTVNVTSSKMEKNEWKKARRRQCCEITNNVESVLRIRVRRCEPGETLSLPN